MKNSKIQAEPRKKIYQKPVFTAYGSIADLTRTANGKCRDNQNAFNNAQPTEGFTCS